MVWEEREAHLVDCDRGHERQVLDQAAGLALWRVRRAQYAPLARLQAARPAHLRNIASSFVDTSPARSLNIADAPLARVQGCAARSAFATKGQPWTQPPGCRHCC